MEHTDICQPGLSDIFSDYQKHCTTLGTSAASRDSVLDPGMVSPHQIPEATGTPRDGDTAHGEGAASSRGKVQFPASRSGH